MQLHYLVHGFGLQTWEYSPVYALRSYAYLGLHAPLASLAAALAPWLAAVAPLGSPLVLPLAPKVVAFYSVRVALAVAAALAEASLLAAVRRHAALGPRVAALALVAAAPAAGLFVAAPGAGFRFVSAPGATAADAPAVACRTPSLAAEQFCHGYPHHGHGVLDAPAVFAGCVLGRAGRASRLALRGGAWVRLRRGWAGFF